MLNYAVNAAMINRNTNIVENIIWIMKTQIEEFNNENTLIISTEDIGVTIGDTYINGKFYRNNKEVVSYKEQLKIQEQNANKELAELVDIVFENDINELMEDN